MNTNTTLSFHRNSIDGNYRTDYAIGNSEFHAMIEKTFGGWYLTTYTFNRVLTGKAFRTLALAKAEAQRTFENVDV